MAKLKPKTNLFSIRQVAQLTGKSERTIYKYITTDKIDYFVVDHMRFIPESQIERVRNIKLYHKPKYEMIDHVTIQKFASLLNLKAQNVKSYIKRGQIEHVTNDRGIFFIPNCVAEAWKQIDNPTPAKVEAFSLDAKTVQDAGLELGYSDSMIRGLIAKKKLKKVKGGGRWYVGQGSINEHKAIQKLAMTL